MFNRKQKKRKGFTLVELIVVIIILGILAAIAIPRLANVRDTANDAADAATARTIISAIQTASVNYNGEIKSVTTSDVAGLLDIKLVKGAPTELDQWGFAVDANTDAITITKGDGSNAVPILSK